MIIGNIKSQGNDRQEMVRDLYVHLTDVYQINPLFVHWT